MHFNYQSEAGGDKWEIKNKITMTYRQVLNHVFNSLLWKHFFLYLWLLRVKTSKASDQKLAKDGAYSYFSGIKINAICREIKGSGWLPTVS